MVVLFSRRDLLLQVMTRSTSVQAVLACLSYASCSTMLNLANKAIFSDRKLNYPWSLLGIQSFVCALMLGAYYAITMRRFPLKTALLRELLLPCSVFALFIFTSARALRYISLPVLSVIKSFAPMGIAATERVLFGERIHAGTYVAMLIILVANLVTVLNDIEYSPVGYMWAALNTIANIIYVVSLRFCVSKNYKNGEKALHLNILLTAIFPPIAIAMGELPGFIVDFSLTSARFRLLFFFSCILAAGIGASVFWVLQSTSGSTLSFIGAANKVSVIILGAILFEVHISGAGWLGIFLGVLGSVAFTVSKLRANSEENAAKGGDRGDRSSKTLLLATKGSETMVDSHKESEKP
jgi:GDP-mannose transporter